MRPGRGSTFLAPLTSPRPWLWIQCVYSFMLMHVRLAVGAELSGARAQHSTAQPMRLVDRLGVIRLQQLSHAYVSDSAQTPGRWSVQQLRPFDAVQGSR